MGLAQWMVETPGGSGGLGSGVRKFATDAERQASIKASKDASRARERAENAKLRETRGSVEDDTFKGVTKEEIDPYVEKYFQNKLSPEDTEKLRKMLQARYQST